MVDHDTEITLGMGRLLGLFFGLVVLCAIFFVAGFTLGKSSAPLPALTENNATMPQPAATTVKPAAVREQIKSDCSSAPDGCAPAGNSNPPSATPPVPEMAASPVQDPPAPAPVPTVLGTGDAAKPGSGPSYSVQVAAVSKQQDAEALAGALRKKNYPVAVITPATDSLFHVQVGPFNDLKDAEATRTRLLSDGYNPIVKR